MKRTDFTQNFPGGIIKGDSRCREGEEMEEKIDLNVCYRKAFEALGSTGSVQKFADYYRICAGCFDCSGHWRQDTCNVS